MTTQQRKAEPQPALKVNERPESLAEALAVLQSTLPTVRKGETASVRSDKGNYSYDYADLEDCTKAIMPLMGPLGLSFSAKPTLDGEGRFVLRYTLRHTSNEEDSGVYPLPDPGRASPQQIGSAITYARRYTLCAVTGLAPGGDDDDGKAAQQTHRPQQRPNGHQANGNGRQQREQAPPPPPPEEGSQEPPEPPAPHDTSAAEHLEGLYRQRMEDAKTPRTLADIGSEIAADLSLDAAAKGRLQPLFTRRMHALNGTQ